MVTTLTPGEEAQLTQTIEMFEVIVQSQPQDYQSLEILREAYVKLSREPDVIHTTKRIANAYVLMGQLSSAILEYESILQKYPGDPDAVAALQDIESKAGELSRSAASVTPAAMPPAPVSPTSGGNTEVTRRRSRGRTGHTQHLSRRAAAQVQAEDGRAEFQKLFLDTRLVAPSDFEACWPVQDYTVSPSAVVAPFIQNVVDKGILPLEKALKVVADKHRLGYVPLERYDIDIELARTFPPNLLRRWCVLPFDRMSKSILVATANPFSKQALAELEETTRQRILWCLASPVEISKALSKVIR
ncbi:MAG: hypothetical protein RJA22_928 [Verrucomicrobiota bacterium]|jgi:tetratricopeptide (TPR) repeat protein